ncbi:MAG: recombinase family protein, partial [Clostridia bacterium]|nr:recombinase family protein [Clostridia bacterium]
MKGVIYARYSSDNQREESIDGQLRECKEFADKNGIEIIGEYIDRALSAKTDNRPEFQKMIKDSYRKLFDTIIVWKVDRFARNRYDSAHYKHLLKKNGVKVVSAREHISEGAEGIILESMLEGYAEYYSVELTEKVNRGLMENALKGKLNGGTIPLGYRLTKEQTLEINEETAPVVLEIFTRYNDGEQIKSIEKDLALRELTNNYGGPITYNRIHYLLKNRRYIGEYRFRDVVHKNAFPAIVPEDLFN